MHGLAFTFLGLAFSCEPIELEKGVVEIQTRELTIPLLFDLDKVKQIQGVRLFFSTDRGKTWKHSKDWLTDTDKMTFSAPKDGLYWFAVQIVSKDGKKLPATLKGLDPELKVYVNSAKRTIKNRQKSYAEQEQEVRKLRKTVEQLKRKIAELESGRRRK
jgi:hypothetical protein